MKHFYTLTLFAFALIVSANAQSLHRADTILLDEVHQNNQITKRYLIRHHNGTKAQFALHFQLDASNLVPTFSHNAQHLKDMAAFVAQLKDTTIHLSSVNIRGYASPDGDHEFNIMLAANRGATFDEYITDHCPNIQPMVSSHAYTWAECSDAVTNSQIPHKEQVLKIIADNSTGERDKENALRSMNDAWQYLEANILPTMRRADICFDYGKNEIVTVVTNVPQSNAASQQPATNATTSQPQPIAIIETEETGIIVELPEKEHHKARKDRK